MCLVCHSWQLKTDRSVTAMTLAIILGVLAIVAIIGTIVAVSNDGYRPIRTDWSRIAGRASATRRTGDAVQEQPQGAARPLGDQPSARRALGGYSA